jgi:hypothetical protein
VRWVVGQIDQGFSGAFLMTTAGDGDYTVYQRVLDPLGLSPDADVVCMLNRCYLEIAHVPEDTLARYGGRREDMGALRQRFAAARDAYLAMRSVQADKRPAMVETWRAAIGQLAACLSDSGRCR